MYSASTGRDEFGHAMDDVPTNYYISYCRITWMYQLTTISYCRITWMYQLTTISYCRITWMCQLTNVSYCRITWMYQLTNVSYCRITWMCQLTNVSYYRITWMCQLTNVSIILQNNMNIIVFRNIMMTLSFKQGINAYLNLSVTDMTQTECKTLDILQSKQMLCYMTKTLMGPNETFLIFQFHGIIFLFYCHFFENSNSDL